MTPLDAPRTCFQVEPSEWSTCDDRRRMPRSYRRMLVAIALSHRDDEPTYARSGCEYCHIDCQLVANVCLRCISNTCLGLRVLQHEPNKHMSVYSEKGIDRVPCHLMDWCKLQVELSSKVSSKFHAWFQVELSSSMLMENFSNNS